MDPSTLDAGVLDDFQGYIISQVATFMGSLGPYHQLMYGTFIFIVLCLLGAKIAKDISVTWTLLMKLVTISVFVWMTTNWQGFTDLWMNTMVWAGTNAGGGHLPMDDAFSSSRIFSHGMKVSGGIIKSAFSLKIIYSTGGIFIAWIYVGAAILTLGAFGFMAIQVFVATTLFQILVSIGLFLLPFGIWKVTAFIAEPVFGVIASYGVSMMVLVALMNLIVGYGDFVIPRLAEFTAAAAASAAMYSLSALYLGLYGRKIASEMISGSPSMGAEEAINTMATGVRMIATTAGAAAGAAVLAGMAGSRIASAATKTAQAASGGSGTSVSSTTSTSGSGSSTPEIGIIKAAGAMHARFESSMRDLGQKAATVQQAQGEKMSHLVHSQGLKRVAREMQQTVGQEGGLSASAAEQLKSRMDSVQEQHTANVSSGMDSDLAAGIANRGYREAVNEAIAAIKTDGPVTTENARESVAMHHLSGDTNTNDIVMANRMGVVSDIHRAAVEGKSSRETMEMLGDRLKPVEEAATMNGNEAMADVHKMGIINSVRDSLGVPQDRQAALTWAKEQKGKESPVAIAQVPGETVTLRAQNGNFPSAPGWLKKSVGGRLTPMGTNGHGGYRVNNIVGD